MDQSAIRAELRRVPLFGAMTEGSIDAIAQLVEPVLFPAGAVLIEEGGAGDTFLVLTAGTVSVARGGAEVSRLGAGDFLGEISLVDGRPRSATVTATSPVEALVLHRDAFLALIDRYPSVRLAILMALTDRIRSNARRASD